MNYLKTIVILILTIVVGACGGEKSKYYTPEKIVFASASTTDPEAFSKRMDLLTAYLTKCLEIPVEYIKVTDYTGVIEGMKYKKVDIGSTGSFAFCLAEKRTGAKALVATTLGNGEMRRYQSLLLTHPGTDIDSVQQILDNPGKYSLAFTDPASTSGHLMPRKFLEEKGLIPESDFKEVLFSGSHTAAIYSLVSQKVDVTASFQNALDRLEKKNKIQKNQYKVLWTSKPIPNSPIFTRSDLDPKIQQKIITAYENMEKDAPEVYKLMLEVYQAKKIIYKEADPKVWDEIREIVAGLTTL